MKSLRLAATGLGALFLPTIVSAQQGDGTQVAIRTHVFKPAKVDATPARIAQLKAAAGFSVSAFATGLKSYA